MLLSPVDIGHSLLGGCIRAPKAGVCCLLVAYATLVNSKVTILV